MSLTDRVGVYDSEPEAVTLQDRVGERDNETEVVTLHERVDERVSELDVVTLFDKDDLADSDADIKVVAVTPADPDKLLVRDHGRDMHVGMSDTEGVIDKVSVVKASGDGKGLPETLAEADAELDADGLSNGDNDKETLGVVDRETEPDTVIVFVRRAVTEMVFDRVSVVDRLLLGETVLVGEAVRQLVTRPDPVCVTLLDPENEPLADGEADDETDMEGALDAVPNM